MFSRKFNLIITVVTLDWLCLRVILYWGVSSVWPSTSTISHEAWLGGTDGSALHCGCKFVTLIGPVSCIITSITAITVFIYTTWQTLFCLPAFSLLEKKNYQGSVHRKFYSIKAIPPTSPIFYYSPCNYKIKISRESQCITKKHQQYIKSNVSEMLSFRIIIHVLILGYRIGWEAI